MVLGEQILGVCQLKAELRRLMLGPVPLAESKKLEQTFIVIVRQSLAS